MAKKRKPAPKEEPSEESEDLSSEEEEEVEEEEEEEEEKGESSSEEEEEESEEDEDEEEVKDEGSKREAIRKLLKPFGKDQLIEILTDAAIKDPSVISKISQAAESDPDHRNIFVHGLGWDTTTETLLSVFKQYGQIEQGTVVTDKVTGMSKGYGFILFKTRAGARKALKDPHKKIGGRMTSCNLASFGPPPNQPTSSDRTGRKLYVANVGPHINPEKLRAFFAKFGEIEEGPLGYDRLTGKLKGYALFIYKTTEGCTKALEQPTKLFEGCQLQCKKAMEGPRANKNQTGKVTGPAIASPTAFPRNDFAPTYSMGLSPGMVSQNQNPAGALVGQNSGIGVMNPVLGTSLNQTGLSSSVASGFSPSVNPNGMTPPLGFNAGFGGHGVNSISPSVMGSYGSQAALQGLGVYHNAQLGQPAAAAAPTNVIGSYGSQAALQGLGAYHNAQLGQSAAAARSQSGLGPIGTIPSYYGR